VENKKIDVLFGVVVIAFLVVTIFLIKDFNAKRTNDYKEYAATVANIVKQKNDKIKIFSGLLAAKQKENDDLKNTLSETRNALESISKKLAQPVAAAAPASVPAPTPTPATATK
jgi:regulatory protein YycI of two-component signal transduction system YycFG